MSVNWVMLADSGNFIRLPNEQLLFTTPARVSFSLDSVNKYPGRQPYHLSCGAGRAYLTNRRLVYLPTTAPPSTSNNPSPSVLYSFAAPLTHIHDSNITSPWFGPNAWTCIVQPVPGGGIPSTETNGTELTLTFKDGGAYDFHTRICEVKERLAQMRELYGVAQEVGGGADGAGALGVHLEQLPAYEDPPPGFEADAQTRCAPAPAVQQAASTGRPVGGVPDEAPPGYEEAQAMQRDGVLEELGRMGVAQGRRDGEGT